MRFPQAQKNRLCSGAESGTSGSWKGERGVELSVTERTALLFSCLLEVKTHILVPRFDRQTDRSRSILVESCAVLACYNDVSFLSLFSSTSVPLSLSQKKREGATLFRCDLSSLSVCSSVLSSSLLAKSLIFEQRK